MTVDWTDACSRLDALRTAYYRLLAGEQAYSIEYVANGVSRKVQYSVIDMARLQSEIRAAERECGGAAARSAVNVVSIRSEKGFL